MIQSVTTPVYGLGFGFLTALVINRLASFLHYANLIYPANVRQANNEYYYWRYRNFFISFCHAFLTGVGSLICVLQTPILLWDVIDTYTDFGYVLTSFSFGYFIYDTLEMVTHLSYKGTQELIFHHILIILCFLNTIMYRKYIGYNMIALLIEISNIFLHFRQLLLLSNYPKTNQFYKVNSVVNIVMFVMIRGSCMFWLWYTLLINLARIPLMTKAIALVSMIGISYTTTILFSRVLNSDFGEASRKSKVNGTSGNGKATENGHSLYENSDGSYHDESCNRSTNNGDSIKSD